MAAPIKIAIVGGSGFMGYDLARKLHESPDYEPIVISTSAKNLANLSRHAIEVKLTGYEALRHVVLPKDVRFLVNYAHPFGNRDGLSISEQVDVLSDFMINNLERNRGLRAVHISSMSVYEPFDGASAFDESSSLRVPRSDSYARAKCAFETKLDTHCELRDRLLVVRPTVVYGPFCRPWTDALLGSFETGDVDFANLNGRIQPIAVGDVSQFVIDRFGDFAPGTFNLAGPETVHWHDFFRFFADVVGRGELVQRETSTPAKDGVLRSVAIAATELVALNLRQPRVKELIRPLGAQLPARFVDTVKHRFTDNLGALGQSAGSAASSAGPYCDPFFEKDRVVSTTKTRERFPDLALTPLESTRDMMTRYHEFRFRDEVLT